MHIYTFIYTTVQFDHKNAKTRHVERLTSLCWNQEIPINPLE